MRMAIIEIDNDLYISIRDILINLKKINATDKNIKALEKLLETEIDAWMEQR
jgi:flagellar motility protein MotE (MotC chaperone)